ncbi:hypothetical protein, partial [Aeromonas caviae]|uniref:hypothetical protein n=1 Tax=Aeromonas caviae TaxID=648 RepID=UPI001C886CFE
MRSGAAVAGDITLKATGETRVVGSGVINDVRSQAVGNGVNITISSGSLSLTDGTLLSARVSGQGTSGNIFLQADNSVSLTGNNTAILNQVRPGGVGNGGDINIT